MNWKEHIETSKQFGIRSRN